MVKNQYNELNNYFPSTSNVRFGMFWQWNFPLCMTLHGKVSLRPLEVAHLDQEPSVFVRHIMKLGENVER